MHKLSGIVLDNLFYFEIGFFPAFLFSIPQPSGWMEMNRTGYQRANGPYFHQYFMLVSIISGEY